MPEMSDVRTIATGLDHPEGVTVDLEGGLYAGGEAGQVYRIDPASGEVEEIARADGGFMLGLCCDGRGAVYACDAGNGVVWRVDVDGTLDRWCESASGEPFACPNWAAFASDGSLYVSDSGPEDPAVVGGRIVRVPPQGGEADVLDVRPLHFANGFTLLDDGDIVVHESFAHRMVRIGPDTVSEIAMFTGAIPDGVAATEDGSFVVSHYYPWRIDLVRPDGATEPLLHDAFGVQFPMPTNVCFFGEDRRTLAIASLGGHGLSAVELDLAGTPLQYPVL